MVEVIKVIDFTEVSVVMQELMFIKVKNCTPEDKTELFQIAQTYQAKVRDYGKTVCFLNLYTRHIKIQRSSSFYVLNSIQLKL